MRQPAQPRPRPQQPMPRRRRSRNVPPFPPPSSRRDVPLLSPPGILTFFFILTAFTRPTPALAEELVLLSGGPTRTSYNSPALNAFVKSFNQTEAASLASPMGPFGLARGARFDLGYGWLIADTVGTWTTAGMGRMSDHNHAVYLNGDERTADVVLRDLRFASEIGVVKESFLTTFIVGWSTTHVTLDSEVRTPSGSTLQDPLSGRYQAWVSTELEMGFSLGIGIQPLYLIARVTWPLLAWSDSSLWDPSGAKNAEGTAYFPSNYGAFTEEIPTYGGNVWGGDFVGPNISIMLALVAPTD